MPCSDWRAIPSSNLQLEWNTGFSWRHTRGSLRSPWYFMRHPTLAPQLDKTHETPPSSRDEGLLFLHGPLQYSCLENPMDGGAWKAAGHGVAEGQTRLSDFTFTFHFHALEKAMATHSSVLAWRIPGTGAPGGLPSMGSHRVGHD